MKVQLWSDEESLLLARIRSPDVTMLTAIDIDVFEDVPAVH